MKLTGSFRSCSRRSTRSLSSGASATRPGSDLYQGEESIEEIAWLYDLEPAQINAAVEFEASLVA